MIKNIYRCKFCLGFFDFFNFKEDFRKYYILLYLDLEEEEFFEFDWVILCLGNGYFEMNMCKIFVELNWDVFFFELFRVMGF